MEWDAFDERKKMERYVASPVRTSVDILHCFGIHEQNLRFRSQNISQEASNISCRRVGRVLSDRKGCHQCYNEHRYCETQIVALKVPRFLQVICRIDSTPYPTNISSEIPISKL